MAIEGFITMNQREVLRLQVIEKLNGGRLGQSEASKLLKVSCRQIRRLLKAYSGKGQNVWYQRSVGSRVTIGFAKMSDKIFWQLSTRIHQMRERRSCFGELIQIDGSPHDWFEGRGEKCCLLVFIDDASSKLVNLRFEEAETTAGYFRTSKEYITKYGFPMAFYSDRHNIFRVNMPGCEKVTQFGGAAEELGIEIICANSAQAKGRVERANQTLQDRLIKEMRLRGISDIKAANAYVPEFIECYDKRFAVEPKSSIDAHVKLSDDEDIDLIFCFKEYRELSKNLELSYYNTIYQIKTENSGYRLRHAKVTVCEDLEGKITIIYKGEKLEYSCHKTQKRQQKL